MYGVPVPGLRLERQIDGVIVRDVAPHDYDRVLPPWSWRMALPGPKQDLDDWARRVAGKRARPGSIWSLDSYLDGFRRDYLEDPYHYDSPGWNDHMDLAQVRWAKALRPLLDYKALAPLRRLAGNARYGLSLAEYNIAAKCGSMLEELSRTNPGAVGWWLASVRKALNEYRSEFTLPEELPAHPGEVIAQAREQFRRLGGRSWKSLARLPAPEIYALTMSCQANIVVPTVDSLAQVPRDPARPGQRLLPPYAIKEQIATIYVRMSSFYCDPYDAREEQRAARRARRDAALERVVGLAVREFAGYAGEPVQISDVADYAVANPGAARRSENWNELSRAAERWHEELADRAAENETPPPPPDRPDLEWSGVLTEYEGADFRARLLTTSGELRAEAALMRHCVGNANYDELCARGETLIFHLEPKDIGPEDESGQRRQATTVELALRDETWGVVQQRGYANRAATAVEEERSWRLQQACNRAEAAAPGLRVSDRRLKSDVSVHCND